MRNFAYTLFDRLFIIMGVLIFSQFPLFMQQYEMRLSGHVAESARFIAELQVKASSAKKTLPEYIQKFLTQKDADFADHGRLLENTVDRHLVLAQAATSLEKASIMTKPFIFVSCLQLDVFQESLHGFAPGLSFTLETFIYAFMGLLLGTWCFRLLHRVLYLFPRRRFLQRPLSP